VLWTHNDGDSDLYGLDRSGVVRARFDVTERLDDWEDLEIAACGAGESCLYLADTGDNAEARSAGKCVSRCRCWVFHYQLRTTNCQLSYT
jgi:hypothetical protein